jgi:hypothetical protein
MEAGKFSFKFSRQTQKNLVGSSKYAYFSDMFLIIYSKYTAITLSYEEYNYNWRFLARLLALFESCLVTRCYLATTQTGARQARESHSDSVLYEKKKRNNQEKLENCIFFPP